MFHDLMGQSYPLGLNPPSLRWKQIETDKVEVVFPENVEGQAQRVANLIHFLYDSSYFSLGPKADKVSVILQNQTTVSNGFVTVGPFRSEFYLNPPQFNFAGSANWLDLLAIHEYRHVEQFVNSKKGVTKLSSLLFGQNGWGVLTGTALPRWFFEGDAIFYETALTQAGRGRTPTFLNEYRSILINRKKIPGYEKASATSLKEFIPDHYTLGYVLTNSMRQRYGADAWRDIYQDAVTYSGIVYPFSRSVKKATGNKMPAYYRNVMDSLKTSWKTDFEAESFTIGEKINQGKKKTFINYNNPVFLNDSTILVEKSGFNEIPTYYNVSLKTGLEQKILKPGIYSDINSTLSVTDSLLIWSERAFDERWGNQNFRVLMLYNLETGKKRQITEETRYFSPELSPNGKKIAVVNSSQDYEFEVHVLDKSSLKVDFSFSDDPSYQYAFPIWLNENALAVVIKKGESYALGKIDLSSGEMTLLISFQPQQISYLDATDDYVFFTSMYNGIDNIYALELATKRILQVTDAPFGAIQPDANASATKLVFSAFTDEGYNLHTMPVEPETWKPVQLIESNIEIDYFQPVGISGGVLSKIPETEYKTSPHQDSEGLVVHSWIPWFLPPKFGLNINADNKMSTISATGSVTYNSNEETTSFGVGIDYARFYPVFSLAYDRSNRSRYVPVYRESLTETDTSVSVFVFPQSWEEDEVTIGMTIPWNLTRGNHFSRLWITNNYHHR
jgi:hypothetical protein